MAIRTWTSWRLRAALAAIVVLVLAGGASVAVALVVDQPATGGTGQTLVDQAGRALRVGEDGPPPLPPGVAPVGPAPSDTVEIHVVRNGKVYTVQAHIQKTKTTDESGRTVERDEVSVDEVNSNLPPMQPCGSAPVVGCRVP